MKLTRSLLVLLPLLATFGCNTMSPPIEGRSDLYASPQVLFSDRDLREQTAIGQISVKFDESHLLHVDVPLRSTTDLQIIVDYRVTFLDQNGIPLGPPTGWTAFTLPPNVYQDIQVNSPTTRAADFRIELRYAR
jgi:uncharacterized protein YcfL